MIRVLGAFVGGVLLLLAAGSPALAEEMYARGTCTFTVRNAKAWSGKVVGRLIPGQKVEVLSKAGTWFKVKLPGGQVGWIYRGYLATSREPNPGCRALYVRHQETLKKIKELTGNDERLKKQAAESKTAMGRAEVRVKELQTAFDRLKEASKNVLLIQSAAERHKKTMSRQKKEIAALKAKADSAAFTDNLKWFVAGALVLLVGWLLGLSMGRGRRKRSSLY